MDTRLAITSTTTRTHTPDAHEGDSSTGAATSAPAIRLRGVALTALADAPECIHAMTEGTLPRTAADFNACVAWLAQNLQKEALQALFSAPPCSRFDKLDLHGQTLTPAALECLAFHLDASCITALNLSGCGLNEAHANAIGTLLAPGSKLTLVRLEGNALGAAGMSQICASLRANKTLKHLSLARCGFEAKHFDELLRVLSRTSATGGGPIVPAQNTTLESLCFAGNELFADDTHDTTRTPPQFLGISFAKFKFVGVGDMPGIKWLDLSNTNILLHLRSAASLVENFNPTLVRLDLAGNVYCFDTLESLKGLKFVTHLVLANVRHVQDYVSMQYGPISLLCLPNLKVLDLRGVRRALAQPGSDDAAAQNRRIEEHLARNPSLLCVKLDSQYADHPLVLKTNLAPFAPDRLGFSMLVGAAGKFLAAVQSMNGVEVAYDGAAAFAGELDLRSTMRMMSVNTTLASFRPAPLEERSGDPGFDWDLAFHADDEPSEEATEIQVGVGLVAPGAAGSGSSGTNSHSST
jgi:hypothetical protein